MAHLLLVDVDNDVVEALGELLRGEGQEVRTASTGEELAKPATIDDFLKVLDRAIHERRAPLSA